MRARDLTKGNIAYHHTLNQDVWDGDELRIDVRYKLLEIAKRFIEYLEVPEFQLKDVILRGSLVNYNYTQYSDFDLHIVTDYAALGCDITEQFYMAKKRIWNDEHDITIRGHEVELYVEDIDAKNISAGTYSVLDNVWLRTPDYDKPTIDDDAVNAKARDLMTQINRAIKAGSVEDITRLQDKIKTMRQAGLDAQGEFSTENLAFKIIRNKGYLDKLYKNKNQKFDQELSLDESEAVLDPRVEEFLDGLTPDDVGKDEIGDYIVHYEGFTDQCQDTEEYRNDPDAVFRDVWHDFRRRMGDQKPINYGITGSDEYPIVYSVFRKQPLKEFIEQLIIIKQGSWILHESTGPVEFKKSSMFDQTLANKARQAPNLLAKVDSFVDSKTVNPTQPWGSKDRPFGAKGPIGMALPKLHYAHLNNDLVLFYEIEGRNPTVIKLYGVFSHDDIGIGQPGNIRKQKSLIQQLSHQRL